MPYTINNRNYKIKKPVKAFHRTAEDKLEGNLTGTYYNIAHTHEIDVRLYEHAMRKPNVGTMGLYLYAFLKMKCDYFGGNYAVTWSELARQTKLAGTTLFKYISQLEMEGYIAVQRQKFVYGKLPEGRLANVYSVNGFDAISSHRE